MRIDNVIALWKEVADGDTQKMAAALKCYEEQVQLTTHTAVRAEAEKLIKILRVCPPVDLPARKQTRNLILAIENHIAMLEEIRDLLPNLLK